MYTHMQTLKAKAVNKKILSRGRNFFKTFATRLEILFKKGNNNKKPEKLRIFTIQNKK